MSRAGRGLVDGFIYHVINRGNNRQEIFQKDEDYRAFIGLMKEGGGLYPVDILAYCIMPNHFHMVLRPMKGEELSKWMHWLTTNHVRGYHQHYGTSGHLWHGRFKNFIVQEDAHLLTVVRYVEANPVRTGLVASARDWEWSSHRENAGSKSRVVTSQISIQLPKFWERHVNTPLTEVDLGALRQSVNRQTPYGAPLWQMELCEKLGLESTLRARGRPRNGEGACSRCPRPRLGG
jgi:putative transposase